MTFLRPILFLSILYYFVKSYIFFLSILYYFVLPKYRIGFLNRGTPEVWDYLFVLEGLPVHWRMLV